MLGDLILNIDIYHFCEDFPGRMVPLVMSLKSVNSAVALNTSVYNRNSVALVLNPKEVYSLGRSLRKKASIRLLDLVVGLDGISGLTGMQSLLAEAERCPNLKRLMLKNPRGSLPIAALEKAYLTDKTSFALKLSS